MEDSISLVMPAYNEAGSIEKTVRSFQQVFEEKGLEYEIIVTEDGSTDGTKQVLEKLSQEENIEAVMKDERLGYTGALKKGVKTAGNDYILFADGDGQYYPEELEKLWKKREEAPVVIGRRVDRADNFSRRAISDGFQLVARLFTDYPSVEDMTSSFRLVRADVAKDIISELKHMKDSSWTEFGIRAHAKGYEQIEVDVGHRERPGQGDTRIYHVGNLPGIVARQLKGLRELRKELGDENV